MHTEGAYTLWLCIFVFVCCGVSMCLPLRYYRDSFSLGFWGGCVHHAGTPIYPSFSVKYVYIYISTCVNIVTSIHTYIYIYIYIYIHIYTRLSLCPYCALLKMWCGCASISPKSGTVSLPIEVVVLLSFICLNLHTYNNVSPAKVSQGAAPLPTSLPILSYMSLPCRCGLGLCPFSGLVYDVLLRSHRGLRAEALCQKSISFHTRDGYW